jgi:hypothetical protein
MRHAVALISIFASVLSSASASSAIEARMAYAKPALVPIALSPATGALMTSDAWRFDGSWNVVLFCPEAAGAHAYAYRFTAEVKDGVLHAVRGDPGAGGWMTLDGVIQTDGRALFDAIGISNDADDVLGIAPRETPYAYPVAARFDGTHGLGAGVERRLCSLHFTRH